MAKMNIPIKDIYKIHILNTSGISERILVFCKNTTDVELNQLFSETDLTQIIAKKIDVKLCNQMIHGDDPIRTVKKKIVSELGISKISYYDIYMFVDTEDYLHPFNVFQHLSKNDTQEITNLHLEQLFHNMNMTPSQIEDALIQPGGTTKQSFTYNDIQELFKSNQKYSFSIPLGQKFIGANDYLFSSNPFHLKSGKESLGFITENTLVSFENDLLLNYGNINGNNIYVCLSENVSEYAVQNELDEEYIFKTYFPLLYKEYNVKTNSDLLEIRETIISKNKEMINSQTPLLYNTIQLYYNVYYQRKEELNYLENGITSFHFKINNKLNVNVPLDVIFKRIHSNKNIPFIKYNPGLRSENIYRLFTTQKTRNGKFIPYLNETILFRLSREIGKSGEIGLYIVPVNETAIEEMYSFTMVINKTGDIFVKTIIKKPTQKDVLLSIVKENINPIIQSINNSLENSGFNIHLIESFEDNYIDVIDLDYIMKIPTQKEFNMSKIEGCVTSIFDIYKKKEEDETRLIYKRVENFVEMNAMQMLIVETLKVTDNMNEVQRLLMSNYNIKEEEANQIIIQFLSEHKDIRGKLVDNPGFPVIIKPTLDGKLNISIKNITSLKYIDFIHIYLDGLLRMSLFPDTTNVSKTEIQKICNAASKIDKKADKKEVDNILTTKFEISNISLQKKIKAIGEDMENEELEETEDIDIDDIKELIYEDNEDEDAENISISDIKGLIYEDEDEDEYNIAEPSSPSTAKSSYTPSQLKGILYEEPDETSSSLSTGNASTNSIDRYPRPQRGGEDTSLGSISDISSLEDNNKGSMQIQQMKQRIVGKSLNEVFNRMKRLKAHDDKLFHKEKVGNFEGYSRSCQRPQQPIALTKSELDRQPPGSYTGVAKYGTDANNMNYYICPKYWCLLTNTAMTLEDVQQGKCARQGVPDNIIPPNASVVPNNAFVYDLTQNGKLKYTNPGYIKDKHPEGHCLPCCFVKQKNNWDCDQEKTNEKAKRGRPKATAKEPKENIAYIISNETFPIKQPHRFGFLPLSIQLFLQIDSNTYVTKENPALIKEGVESILRYGVQQYRNQSILGSLVDIYAYTQNIDVVPSIETFKNQILPSAITLDKFISYHNGSLVSVFKENRTSNKKVNNINVFQDMVDFSKYETSDFFKKVDINNEYQYDFFKETVLSYENFIEYLQDPSSIIDHTYLWDLIVDDNPALIKGGVNLIILEVSNHDITDHVELVCPTHSRFKLFDPKKRTFILIKIGEFYEPIYQYKIVNGIIQVNKTFHQNTSVKNVSKMLQVIEKTRSQYCAPLPSMPRIYKFTKNISLYDLFIFLREMNCIITKQVMNYQGKIIGLSVKRVNEQQMSVFVPCLPSGIIPELNDIETVWMDNSEAGLWNDYRTTVNELQYIKQLSGGKIPCQPKLKMVEDGLVVGILTETNQFVKIDPPSENIEADNLEQIELSNYIEADKALTSNASGVDTQREEMIQRINLESQFYLLFRTTIRNLLSDYSHNKTRNHILQLIDQKAILYKQKLQGIVGYLKTIGKDKILFKEIDINVLKIYDELSCFNKESCGTTEYCIIEENGNCQLVVPARHLISGYDNEEIYYTRIADELLRYKRLRNIILYPKLFYNITEAEYSIYDDEFIMLQSSLTPDYFKNMDPIHSSNKFQNSNHNNAMPQISVPYLNEIISLDDQFKELKDTKTDASNLNTIIVDCVKEKINIIGNATASMWKRIFPQQAKEIVFKNANPVCSYYVLLTIFISKYGQTNVTIQDIKRVIWDGYSGLYGLHKNTILKILKMQGKFDIVKKVKNGTTTLENIILSDQYYITDLDIWIFALKTKIQVCLFNRNMLKGLDASLEWIFLNNLYSEKTYFIRSPSLKHSNEIPSYNLITPSLYISELKEFEVIVQNTITGRDNTYKNNIQSLNQYLESMKE